MGISFQGCHSQDTGLTSPLAFFKTPLKGTEDHAGKKSLDMVHPPKPWQYLGAVTEAPR